MSRWESLTRPAKRKVTVSPGKALTVLGEKVMLPFWPTRTLMFLQCTAVKNWTRPKRSVFEESIVSKVVSKKESIISVNE